MKGHFDECARLFDRSPQPFGIVRVILDEKSEPQDAIYEYLNPSMLSITDQTLDELRGEGIYRIWPDGDRTWLRYYYLAAYHNQVNEFETVSEAFEQFLNVVVFPIEPGYCGFFIQDMTNWVGQAQLSLENTSSGIFFFDLSSRMLLLTSALRKMVGMQHSYTDLEGFIKHIYGGEGNEELLVSFDIPADGLLSIFHEGRSQDGTWYQLSLGHTGSTDRFAYGLLRDISRIKEAEDRSAKRMDIIDSISRENFALYLVDLDDDLIELYRIRDDISNPLTNIGGRKMRYTDYINLYLERYVQEADREKIYNELARESIIKRLDSGVSEFSLSFKRSFSEDSQFVELRIVRLNDLSHNIVIAVRSIQDELHEQLRQKEILQNALELAKHANDAKSTFLTNMSHDFRTPMNSITGFAGIALDNIDDREKVEDCLHKILLSSEHLLSLINDILDVSRIESGKMVLDEEVVSIGEIKESIESVFTSDADYRGIDFKVIPAEIKNRVVRTDKMKVNQILLNTVGNAMKFTPRGGSVTVSLKQLKCEAPGYASYEFTVEDTGYGMSPEFVERIFVPFEREANSVDGNIEGTGLGMTITKNLVELFNGTIEVESKLGEGSRFIITLPMRTVEDEATERQFESKDDKAYKNIRFDGFRALVVDDDVLSREVMVEILKKYGFEVIEAQDGEQAVQVFKDSADGYFDILIMDMRMPKKNGDEATKEIRSLDREDAEDIPIVAATADAFEEGYRRAREVGMTAHTTKPIKTKSLITLLADLLIED